ncbi:hypothetical protein ABID16_000203 [Rhizobium aquaticum]|uniref:Urease operon accessory protein n=1 Tax=Rhizobium aquaticum TaxID=1549636 RepID=A0ABV2IU59_9HYPH
MGRLFMVVGNGDIGPQARAAISDAHAVMRFNDCRSAGEDAERTDIVVVCNTGRPGKKMLEEPAWRAHPSVAAANEIWCVRDPAKFAEMRAPLAVTHPELDDFCDDYTDGFRDYAEAEGKGFRIIPRAVHERLDEALSAFSPAPYVTPSTGLVTIADLIENRMDADDRIGLAGFSHQGWDGHPWAAERQYIEPLEARGLVTRITETKHA